MILNRTFPVPLVALHGYSVGGSVWAFHKILRVITIDVIWISLVNPWPVTRGLLYDVLIGGHVGVSMGILVKNFGYDSLVVLVIINVYFFPVETIVVLGPVLLGVRRQAGFIQILQIAVGHDVFCAFLHSEILRRAAVGFSPRLRVHHPFAEPSALHDICFLLIPQKFFFLRALLLHERQIPLILCQICVLQISQVFQVPLLISNIVHPLRDLTFLVFLRFVINLPHQFIIILIFCSFATFVIIISSFPKVSVKIITVSVSFIISRLTRISWASPRGVIPLNNIL